MLTRPEPIDRENLLQRQLGEKLACGTNSLSTIIYRFRCEACYTLADANRKMLIVLASP